MNVNPYLNLAPTKIKEMLENATGKKKQLLKEAYIAWQIAQRYDRFQDIGMRGLKGI